MFRRIGIAIILLVVGVHGSRSLAASIGIETFSTSLGSWTNAPSGTVWRATNGYAEVNFAASPGPGTSTLSVTGGVSAATFLGDYHAAGVEMIGFKFRAEQVLPSTLSLRVLSGTNGYVKFLQTSVLATGTWYQFFVSLESKAEGRWDGSGESLFEDVLAAIDAIQISVTKPATMTASRFRVDDVVIDRLPAASALLVDPAGLSVHGDYLQTNAIYAVETTADLAGPWSVATLVTATNRMQWIAATNASGILFARFAAP